MNTLLICLLIAVLLPYLSKIPVVMAMKELGGYDNNHPRAQQARLEGYGGRAVAAHQNSFESLIVFATAVLAALATNHLTVTIQYLAILHIITRIIYHVLYLNNLATYRTLTWSIGIISSISILVLCL